MLARVVDKARAKLAGTLGQYEYDGIQNQILSSFLGIDTDDFCSAVKTHSTDDKILKWVKANQIPRSEAQIRKFNKKISSYGSEDWHEGKVDYIPGEAYEYERFRLELFEAMRQRYAPNRSNVSTWFDICDAEEGRLKNQARKHY